MEEYRPVGWRRTRKRWKRGCGWRNVGKKMRANPIRVYRLASGTTHRDLANLIEVSERTVRRWQSGPYPPVPSVPKLIALAWVFRLSNPGQFVAEYCNWLGRRPIHYKLWERDRFKPKPKPAWEPHDPPPSILFGQRSSRLV